MSLIQELLRRVSENTKEQESTKIKNPKWMNPGLGLVIMGLSYLLWWCLFPAAWEAFNNDNRWAHNWTYAIIILTVGASWYHKSITTRFITSIQATMLPITATGSLNTVLTTIITAVIAFVWALITIIEKFRKNKFGEKNLPKRTRYWIYLHAQVLSWLLIAHMGLVFLFGRIPFENQLIAAGNIGFLVNLPPEFLEIASWTFNFALFSWAIIALYEQFKSG